MSASFANVPLLRIACALALCTLPTAAAAAPPTPPAPCTLLTPAEVSGVLGGTFGAGQPIGTTGCSWTAEKPHMIVTVSLWPPTEWDRMKASALPGTTNTPAPGLGD